MNLRWWQCYLYMLSAACLRPRVCLKIKDWPWAMPHLLGFAPDTPLPLLGLSLGWHSVGAYFCCGGQSHLSWMCSGQSQEKGKTMWELARIMTVKWDLRGTSSPLLILRSVSVVWGHMASNQSCARNGGSVVGFQLGGREHLTRERGERVKLRR